ncbi:MAG: EthD domain-containing protein, partial [Acidimicrobiales bacterium]
ATTEYVVVDGHIPVVPNTLNAPYPCTRSGFVKVSALIAARPGTDYDEFFEYWLGPHAGNVADALDRAGGIRYVISLSEQPADERYAGMAELYFPDRDALGRYRQLFERDDMDRWVDSEAGETFLSTTEMVGIP